eukprot:ANDGO_08041.mRNA.1 Methylthioribose-1-phosphate isomerase
MELLPMIFDRERGFRVLNQLLLPGVVEYVSVQTCEQGFDAIRSMKVRGAPAIAISAALSLASELLFKDVSSDSSTDTAKFILDKLHYLSESRPTAVNLSKAVAQLSSMVAAAQSDGLSSVEIKECFIAAAETMLVTDAQDNEHLAKFGVQWLVDRYSDGRKLRVATHCNTGALATARYGTALGIIRFLFKQGRIEHVYATETRPYNQGARLTIFELQYEGIPATLICDSAAAFLMQKQCIDAVIVGADRVCANGDTANKIGTYSLAVNAQFHNVPFIVAAPSTSIDLNLTDGSLIPIEERSSAEITHNTSGLRVVVEGAQVWNPSFDVTPSHLIGAVVSELGVVSHHELDGSLDVSKIVHRKS